MAEIQAQAQLPSRTVQLGTVAAVSGVLFLGGAVGLLSEVWGYAVLLVSAVLLLGSAALFATFLLSHRFDGESLKAGFIRLFLIGAAAYVIGVAALGGYFLHETITGRLALKWILFGPAVLGAIIVLDVGIYRLLVEKNLPTYRRYRRFISREASDPASMRQVLFDEVVLQKSLFSVSRLRWLRHTLIFWGFMLLFATELFAVLFREILYSFGWTSLWAPDHPLRLLFDFAFEVFGLAVLVGCVLAFIWRWSVRGTEEEKFSDTPTALFLFLVVLSGFLVEALRISVGPADAIAAISFVGYALAALLGPAERLYAWFYEPLWWLHVFGSCLFIAYVPVKRLIHSCATPMGRLMNSQKALLEAKRRANLAGLFRGPAE